MTTYEYRCGSCRDETDRDFPMGDAPRLVRCESASCGGTMQQVIGRGVQIAVSALENKGAAVRHILTKDDQLDADMPAYKRMRQRGIQPKQIDGARFVENEVNDTFDVTYRPRLEAVKEKHGIKEPWESTRERAREGLEAAKESGWSPVAV